AFDVGDVSALVVAVGAWSIMPDDLRQSFAAKAALLGRCQVLVLDQVIPVGDAFFVVVISAEAAYRSGRSRTLDVAPAVRACGNTCSSATRLLNEKRQRYCRIDAVLHSFVINVLTESSGRRVVLRENFVDFFRRDSRRTGNRHIAGNGRWIVRP